jgi:glycosyltransferase involved in cell wall biosynthesis
VHQSIAILQESVENYRIRFFDELNSLLIQQGVEMTLWVHKNGIPPRHRGLPYLRPLHCYGKGRLSWARIPKEVRDADLVIQPQQVRHLSFLLCLLQRRAGKRLNAFWGHGRCFAPEFDQRLSERFKRWISVRVDWWFAYNDLSARIVKNLGFPEDRITSVMNSSDTIALRTRHEEIVDEGLVAWRYRLGLGPGPIGLFLGRLYFNKRVDFTLRAVAEIRKRIPSFEMIFIGDGEDRFMVETAVAENPWIHYAGVKNDVEKVPYMALADVVINPGVVGLVINDAMAMGLPTITTNFPTHSPEIDYLNDGINGVITSPWEDVARFAEATVELLQNPSLLASMKAAAFESGNNFSAEIMAANFANGIVNALKKASNLQ